MTTKEFPAFLESLAKLFVMYRQKMDTPAARVYFEALNDVPLPLLQRSMAKLLAHGGDFMPTASRIRETVDELEEERAAVEQHQAQHLALDGHVDAGAARAFTCRLCEDTGLRKMCPGGCPDPNECPNLKRACCEHYKGGMYSVPVGRCECAPTNPELMRKRKAEGARPRKYARTGPGRRERNFYGSD